METNVSIFVSANTPYGFIEDILIYFAKTYTLTCPKNQSNIVFLFLFCLWFNVPVNNFLVMLRRSHLFLGITSTFGE